MKKSNIDQHTFLERLGLPILIIFIIGLFAPLMIEFSSINLFCKILMIIGSLFSLFILSAVLIHKIKLQDDKKKFLCYYIPLVTIFVLSIISYFDYSVFNIKNTILGFFLIFIVFLGIYRTLKGFSNKAFLSENFMVVLVSLLLLLLWMAGVYESSDNKELVELFLKISVGLIYLLAISIVISTYLYSSSKKGLNQKIIGIIFWGAIIIFSLPYYIKWWNISDNDFNIFIGVYNAVIGGGITLIGVAWTIKKSNDDRKEQNNLSVKPLIYPVACMSDYNYKDQIDIVFYKTSNSTKHKFIGIIKNTDNGVLIIQEAIINDEKYYMKFPVVLDKNIPGQIIIYYDTEITIETMYILGKDVLGNSLKYKIFLKNDKYDIEAIIEE